MEITLHSAIITNSTAKISVQEQATTWCSFTRATFRMKQTGRANNRCQSFPTQFPRQQPTLCFKISSMDLLIGKPQCNTLVSLRFHHAFTLLSLSFHYTFIKISVSLQHAVTLLSPGFHYTFSNAYSTFFRLLLDPSRSPISPIEIPLGLS